MKDIFLWVLNNMTRFGNLTSAMFDDGYAKVTIVDKDVAYDITVVKKISVEEEKND